MSSPGKIAHCLPAGGARAASLYVKAHPVKSRTGRSQPETIPTAKNSTRSGWVSIFLAVVLTLMGAGTVVAEDEPLPQPTRQWRVSATVNYSSGSYGTDSTTNILYAPMTVRRMFKDGDVSLTIPLVVISGTGAVRLVGGTPTRTSSSTGSATASSTVAAAGGSGSGKGPGAQPLSSSTTDGGLGDIILRGRYYLIEEGAIMPLVAITGRIKLPTADADSGLGTGEFDEGVGVELTKSFGDRWLAYLDGGYNIIGDAPGTNFNNQWWYDVGVGYEVTKQLQMSLFYEEYRALVNTVSNYRDLLTLANYIVDDALHLTGSVLIGLSNGAPNYGVGCGVRFRF